MTRTLWATVAVITALLTVPAGSAAQIPAEDSVTGTFTAAAINFMLDAHSGPSGENPRGTFVAPVGEFSVACLRVSGRTAVIGVNGPFSSLLQVVDAPVDTFAATFPPGPLGPDSCENPPVFSPIDVTSGDLVVIDAQPLPTSKEQCKNGGWRTFGATFKNHGQCVAFVQRGPKP